MVIANRWTQHTWNPLREWQEVQREFARLLNETRAPQPSESQAVPFELRTGTGGALLLAALPGYASEDLEISVERDVLSISAKTESSSGEAEPRTSSSFQRTLRLPFRVDAENTVATMTHGMLEVRLPKAAEDAPRRIAVRAQAPTHENYPAHGTEEEN